MGSSTRQQVGVVHQRPADRHALALPAGQLVGQVASAVREAELVEQLVGAVPGLVVEPPATELANGQQVLAGVEERG